MFLKMRDNDKTRLNLNSVAFYMMGPDEDTIIISVGGKEFRLEYEYPSIAIEDLNILDTELFVRPIVRVK